MRNILEIFKEGHEEGFSTILFEELIDIANDGKYIFEAGIRWSNFQFDIGQKALENLDKIGIYILLAGIYWKEFDYNSALIKLEELSPDGYWLFKARYSWNLDQNNINLILEKDTGMWAFEEYKLNCITKREALERNPNIKWQKKIENFNNEIQKQFVKDKIDKKRNNFFYRDNLRKNKG